MEHAVINVSPEFLAKLFNVQEVEHVAVRTGLSGIQTIQLKVRDPRIPKGTDEIEVVVRRLPNGAHVFGWRLRGGQTIISSPPLVVVPTGVDV